MTFSLCINNQGVLYDATNLCEGEIRLETVRRGAPAKLTFSIVKQEGLSFFEGNEVTLVVNGMNMFKGYVFRKSRTKEQIIQVTAYDQLRYLKNKDTYVYTNKTASELLAMVAADYKLQTGAIVDTGFALSRIEDMQELMDIVYNALDLTLIQTGELYVLYDDFGALTLKNFKDMRLDVILSARAYMIDYSYSTDIDTDTYNKIKLVRDNKDAQTREAYIAKDSDKMNAWGVLQRHEKVDENMTEAQIKERVDQMLKHHNRVHRTLSIEHLAGDLRLRAGCSLFVEIPDLGEINLNNLLVVEKCVHMFSNNEHMMRLDFEGSCLS